MNYPRDTENVSFWTPHVLEYGREEAGVWKKPKNLCIFPNFLEHSMGAGYTELNKK